MTAASRPFEANVVFFIVTSIFETNNILMLVVSPSIRELHISALYLQMLTSIW